MQTRPPNLLYRVFMAVLVVVCTMAPGTTWAADALARANAELERAETWHRLGRATGNDRLAFEQAAHHYTRALQLLYASKDPRFRTARASALAGLQQAEASVDNASSTFRNVVRDAWWVSGADETVEEYDDTWMRALDNAWAAQLATLETSDQLESTPVIVRVNVASKTALLGDNLVDDTPVERRTELVRDELLGQIQSLPSLYGLRPAEGRARVGPRWESVSRMGAPMALHVDKVLERLGYPAVLVIDVTVPDTFSRELPVGHLEMVRVQLEAQLWTADSDGPVLRDVSVGLGQGAQDRWQLVALFALGCGLFAALLGALAFRDHVRLEMVRQEARGPKLLGLLGFSAFFISAAASSAIGTFSADYLIDWSTPMFVGEFLGIGLPYLPTLLWPLVYGMLVMGAPLALITYATFQLITRLGDFEGRVQPDLVVAVVGPAAQLGAVVQVFEPLLLAEPGSWWRVGVPWAALTGLAAWTGAQALAELLPPRPAGDPGRPFRRLAVAGSVMLVTPALALIDGWAIPVCTVGALVCVMAHFGWKSPLSLVADAARDPEQDGQLDRLDGPGAGVFPLRPELALLPVSSLVDALAEEGTVWIRTRHSARELDATVDHLLDALGLVDVAALAGVEGDETPFGPLTVALRRLRGDHIDVGREARSLEEVGRLGGHLRSMIEGLSPLGGLFGDGDDADGGASGYDRSAFIATAAELLLNAMQARDIRLVVVRDYNTLDAGTREVCERLAASSAADELRWVVTWTGGDTPPLAGSSMPDAWQGIQARMVPEMDAAQIEALCEVNDIDPLEPAFAMLVVDAAQRRVDRAHELLRSLAQMGILRSVEGRLQLDVDRRTEAERWLEQGAAGLYDERLAMLDATALSILHCAAGCGPQASMEELLAGVGCTRSEARDALDRLTSGTEPWLETSGRSYRFCSELARRAVYAGAGRHDDVLRAAEARTMHHHVAAQRTGPLPVPAARRWHHARAGGLVEHPLGVTALLDLTADMMRRVGWTELLALLGDHPQAVDSAPEEARRTLYQRGLTAAIRCRSLPDQERYQDALEALLTRRFALGLPSDAQWARATLDYCESIYLYARHHDPAEICRARFNPLAKLSNEGLAVAILDFYTLTVMKPTELESMLLGLHVRVSALTRSPVVLHLESRILTFWANAVMSRVERALATGMAAGAEQELDDAFYARVRRARTLKEMLGDADGLGLCWSLDGRAHEAAGEWDAALAGMEQNLAVCTDGGLDHRLSKAHNDVARVLCKRNADGDLALALEHSNAARVQALRLEQTFNLAFAFHQRLVLWRASAPGAGLAPGAEWGADERALVQGVVENVPFLQRMVREVLEKLVAQGRGLDWMEGWREKA